MSRAIEIRNVYYGTCTLACHCRACDDCFEKYDARVFLFQAIHIGMTIRDYGPYLHFTLTDMPGILGQTAVRIMFRAAEYDRIVTRFRCMKNMSTLFSSWQDHVNVRCMRKIAIDLRRAGWRAGEWFLLVAQQR